MVKEGGDCRLVSQLLILPSPVNRSEFLPGKSHASSSVFISACALCVHPLHNSNQGFDMLRIPPRTAPRLSSRGKKLLLENSNLIFRLF